MNTYVITIYLGIFIIAFIAFSIILLRAYLRKLELLDLIETQIQRLEISKLLLDHENIADLINNLLDTFITDCFDEYKIKALLPEMEDKELYITDELEIRIRNDLIEIVTNRISPSMIDTLSIYFNQNNLGDVIANRIYYIVMTFCIQSRIDNIG